MAGQADGREREREEKREGRLEVYVSLKVMRLCV